MNTDRAQPLPCGLTCTSVKIEAAQLTEITPQILLTGEIQAEYQSNIAFRVSGKITQRLVEIGEHVTPDQILAVLDKQDQSANLETARAGLASAQSLLTQAKVAFDRQATLIKDGYTTRTSFDHAQQTLRTQEAATESAQAAVGTAEEQLRYTDLKSGVAGILTAREAETGQVVQPGQTVFTIAHDGPRDAIFNVYESLLIAPPASKQVKIYLQADPSIQTTGTVREISPTVDSTTGSVKVKVGLDDIPEGMSLGAAVVGSGKFKQKTAIVISRGALFRWKNAPAVWILDPKTNMVELRNVVVDQFEGDKLVISGGIETGDLVVTAGIQFLHPGQIVEKVPMEASK